MQRASLAILGIALVVFFPVTLKGSSRAILSQLENLERQTRTARTLDAAKREQISARVRDLTQQFYRIPKRDPKVSAEFGRLSASVWNNLRELSVDRRMQGLPAWPTPRDKEFERQLQAIEAHCRNLPKPVSRIHLRRSTKPAAVRQLRDDVIRFAREYRHAVQQYHADAALVSRYQPESRPGVYKLDQARALLGQRALKQLREAPARSSKALSSQAIAWLDDAKSDLKREANMKPSMPGFSPSGDFDPILHEVFPDLRPGDPYPFTFPTWPLKDDGVESDYAKVKRLVHERHDQRVNDFGIAINETLESAWNAARLGAALDIQLGGDGARWQQTIAEAERLARSRSFELTDRLTESRDAVE